MEISPNGVALIKRFEGCVLTAYKDVVGISTIGWGHTGPDVHDGLQWTQEKADEVLASDITEKAVIPLNRLIPVTLTQNQFDALVSFVYNVGAGAFAGSHMHALINYKRFDLARLEFVKWDHAGGKTCPGLLLRRTAEAVLFGS